MMKKIILAGMLFNLILLSGCVKILNDELKTKETKLVLNAAISTDSVFTVNVSRTFNIFEDESVNNLPFIDSAKVQLYEDNHYLFDLNHTSYGFYNKPDFFPQLDKEYKVDVSYGSYKPVESKAIIPPKVPIVAFDTSTNQIADAYGGNEIDFIGEITYNDPPGVSNYYQLSCRIYIIHADSSIDTYQQAVWPVDENERFFESTSGGNLLWNDKLTEGKEVSFKFVYFSSYEYKSKAHRDQEHLRFVFYLKSITQAYFTYLKSLGVYWETGGTENPFSEPVVIYSNVDNGYGILGGYSTDSTSITYTYDTNGDGGKP